MPSKKGYDRKMSYLIETPEKGKFLDNLYQKYGLHPLQYAGEGRVNQNWIALFHGGTRPGRYHRGHFPRTA
jgi:hypothetical protein